MSERFEPSAAGDPPAEGDPRARDDHRIPASAGLCAHCVHARTIATRRGSTFVLCAASQTDASLARYPRLPVVRCHAFTPAPDASSRDASGGP